MLNLAARPRLRTKPSGRGHARDLVVEPVSSLLEGESPDNSVRIAFFDGDLSVEGVVTKPSSLISNGNPPAGPSRGGVLEERGTICQRADGIHANGRRIRDPQEDESQISAAGISV
jgi:hypothetical protein